MLVIEGNVYYQSRLTKCCVGIDEGKIVQVKKVLKGDTHLDFGDKLVLPAGIDVHVHFREPGFTHKEDFQTGSMSAAFGGIATVLDMPNTKPPTITPKAINAKIEIGRKKSFVDFGIYGGAVVGESVKQSASLCTAFKVYMASAEELVVEDGQVLREIFSETASAGKVTAVHCERQSQIRRMEEKGPRRPSEDKEE